MKRFISILTAAVMLLTALPASAQMGRVDFNNTSQGEQSVNYKFWVCIIGCPKKAITSVRLDTVASVSKHTYNVGTQTIREVTVDTAGNNSIRFYCMNVNSHQARMRERTRNTRSLVESHTGADSSFPTKSFPEGTYSHNVEYQVEKTDDLDTIYDSIMTAILNNRGCILRI